ncbi:hypothetical protein BKA82DRAFT_996316 [Pisolithus tinctorius]|uniref:Uncharacterized protein n=1 Tax=Pisolithus tinctorius Marx 270 TaxID=870435 RepID=A0A0C3PL82_PISTI|nr:hypothetical protein BKA82DRAFT_996316 [Pisolithus tinctorius]KIO09471.1 hypothetical protein M404DRAFT_996316 [Pisolithus tinctorius Marx 270]
MTSDVPRPKQDGKAGHLYHGLAVNLSPAQIIAEAWQRESAQTQEFWRQAEAKRKEQYSAPRPPRPRSGKM